MTIKSSDKAGPAAQRDYGTRRRPSEKDDFELNAAARALLASFEESVRPTALAVSFPRIVNRMTTLWRKPREMDHYFDQLVTDDRGNRQGFPLKVLMELSTLKSYYRRQVFPAQRDVWETEDGSTRR